jgi:hypothetical protein
MLYKSLVRSTSGPYTLIKERQATTITAESAELAEKYQEKTLRALRSLRLTCFQVVLIQQRQSTRTWL